MVCPYCGSKELILESDEVTIERIRNATYKDIEHEKMSFEQAKYNDRKQEKKTTSFKSGKFCS